MNDQSEIESNISKPHVFFYGYIIVLTCFFMQVLMFGPRASFGVFITPITMEFDWSRALVAGAFSLSSLVQGMSSILMGGLNDRFGPRKVLTSCGILVGSGLILMSMVRSAWQLYMYYAILIGLGMGGLYSPQMSTVARWFTKRRNIMTGMLMAGGGVGGLIGPPLITWLVINQSWRKAFLYAGITVFLLITLLAQLLVRDPAQIGQEPYGQGPKKEKDQIRPAAVDISLKRALGTRQYWMMAVTFFFFGYCHLTVMVHLVPHSMDRGISATTASLILSTMSFAMTMGSVLGGLVADRIGNRKVFFICICLLLAVGFFLLPTTSAWLFALIALCMASGSGGVAVLESSLVANLFGMKDHGAILGTIAFAFTLGGSLGPFLAGAVYDITGTYQLAFLSCTIFSIMGLLISISLIKHPQFEAQAV